MKQDVNMEKNWYLVQCKPKQSFRAELNLNNQGYTCFHPTIPVKRKVNRQGQAQILSTKTPLFPHYLFIKLANFESWLTIRSTRGVKNIVMFGGIPCRVSEDIIDGIKHHCELLNGRKPAPLFNKGDKVRITEGCFKELEAIVMADSGEERISLLLNLFNRQHRMELPLTAVVACS